MRFLAVILLVVFVVDQRDTASINETGHENVICGKECIEPIWIRDPEVCCVYNVDPIFGNAYCCYDTNNGGCTCVA